MEDGARICDVLELAGGFNEAAAKEALNQAEPVVDGQMIKVPDRKLTFYSRQGVLIRQQSRRMAESI